jgi:hypothetical protein
VVGNEAWRDFVAQNMEEQFPNLRSTGYELTSSDTIDYNCVAWAVEAEQEEWWWPDPMGEGYWPASAPREETLEAFVATFELCGYDLCDTDKQEPGFEKIAIYVSLHGSKPTHVARLKPNKNWTSKIGSSEDIEHVTLDGLTGEHPAYGKVAQCMKRRISD